MYIYITNLHIDVSMLKGTIISVIQFACNEHRLINFNLRDVSHTHITRNITRISYKDNIKIIGSNNFLQYSLKHACAVSDRRDEGMQIAETVCIYVHMQMCVYLGNSCIYVHTYICTYTCI